jgi:hypothetical protein
MRSSRSRAALCTLVAVVVASFFAGPGAGVSSAEDPPPLGPIRRRPAGRAPSSEVGPIVIIGGTNLSPEEIAKLPPLDAAGLQKILAQPGVKVMTPATMRKTIANVAKAIEANNRVADETLAGLPHLATAVRTTRAKMGEERKVRLGGGRPRAREGQVVTLISGQAMAKDIALGRKMLEDPKQRVRAYEAVYAAIQERAGSAPPEARKRIGALPAPADAVSQGLKAIDDALGVAVRLWLEVFVPRIPTTPVVPKAVPCTAEEGAGYGGDMTDTGGTANPNGLLARAGWPLKGYETCVREQGNRGTCPSFAIIGAAETLIAANTGRYVNLSEQDLYKKQRLDFGPFPPDFFDDGYAPPLSLLFQLLSGYTFPWERDWDYNPSWSRVANSNTRTYANSCVGYQGEACSETNHQANRRCYQVDVTVVKEIVKEVCEFLEGIPFLNIFSGWVCEQVTEVITTVEKTTVCVYDTQIPGTSGFRVRGFNLFYIPVLVSPSVGIETAKFYLSNKKPLVLCFQTAASFDNNSGGYVSYTGTAETNRGGHCVAVTGYVDNPSLPAGIPPGAGGGYLVVKNSWGTSFGDRGYAYLPYDWVKAWATCMIAITDVG